MGIKCDKCGKALKVDEAILVGGYSKGDDMVEIVVCDDCFEESSSGLSGISGGVWPDTLRGPFPANH